MNERLFRRALVLEYFTVLTFVCATLTAALLLGLVLRYSLNIWIADPVVGLIISGYLIKEGIELIKGECDDRS